MRIENPFFKELAALRDKKLLLTEYVDEDESCLFFFEGIKVSPPNAPLPGQRHRYERILVNRGDKIAEWWFDLGLAADFTANLFQMPCLWLHSVGEARECAMANRAGVIGKIEYEPRDIWGDYFRQEEEKEAIRQRKTTVGPFITIQRN